MSLSLSDLAVEQIIRDGFQYARNNPSVFSDIFGRLLVFSKFGQKEIDKIVTLFTTGPDVFITKNFPLNAEQLPCVSIQIMTDVENQPETALDDFLEETIVPYTTPQQLASTIILGNVTPLSYTAASGYLQFSNTVNLANIYPNQLFVDSLGNTYVVQGVDTSNGNNAVVLLPNLNPGPALGAGSFKTSINYSQYEERMVIDKEQILVGIHTLDRLTTIYLYNIVKYFILSRKFDLMNYGMINPTFSGSDFNREMQYTEPVFSRFITITSITENSWRSTQVTPIESAIMQAEVQQDVATAADIGSVNASIIPYPDPNL